MIYKGYCKKAVIPGGVPGFEVAIKVYFKNKVSHTKLRAIKREVAMMQYLDLKKVPNIVKVYFAFADDLHYYIVMEYCRGGDLLEWILARKRALHEKDALQGIALPLLDTLCHLHSMNIIHRDIKLENIFLDANMKIKLGDFGLTMSCLQETAISPVGTVEYMAPEVISLPSVDMIVNKKVDPKTIQSTDEKVDVWAMGVTLYELVTGKLPFGGKDKQAIKQAIASYNIASFPDCLSLGCREIILEMLSYKASSRPSAFTARRRISKFLSTTVSPGALPLLKIETQGEAPQSYHHDTFQCVDAVDDGLSVDNVSQSTDQVDQCHFPTAVAPDMNAMPSGNVVDQTDPPVKKSDRFARVFRRFSGKTGSRGSLQSSMDASMDSQSSLNPEGPLKSALQKIFKGV
jgi:serine/threonine protein kinase